jgi:hypothetical protein
MDKNAIKKFATEARRELISRVGQRALKYGISDQEVGNPNDDSVGGHLLSSTEKKQRAALIEQIKEKGYEQVMEEVAYTWFNRFSALRFMEVNGYLPTRVRVFTDENNAFKPQILTEAIHMELDGLDMEKVYAYKDANDNDELYKYLLITQCNALNRVLPGMFQKIADYTELLFPDNLLREGSVVQQMIELIDEEDWKDAVQIIGWLYQYYNSEKKDNVFAALKKNVKITKENIPAATQLFTPDWIVRYMVENSLGRLWVEGHPNDELKSGWKYYLEEAEQEPDVQVQLASIREEYKILKPEDIRCIDPCSGSGHILAYMFDVLVQIYEAYGVDTRTAVASIVENNIYGLDIDDRAAQLAYFSVMMKACQYDKRFLRRKIQPHVYAIVESNHVDSFAVEYFCNGDEKLKAAMDTIIEELHDAKEYGSIITVSQQDWNALYARFDEIEHDDILSLHTNAALALKSLVQVAEALSQKYDVVVTNPPYMGGSGMSTKLSAFVKKQYPDSKSDLFAVFIEKCGQMAKKNGFQAMITQQGWMFFESMKNLRRKVLYSSIVSMAHLGSRAFNEISGEVVQTTSFVIRRRLINDYIGKYVRLLSGYSEEEKEQLFLSGKYVYVANQKDYSEIPSTPIAYWVGNGFMQAFKSYPRLADHVECAAGISTGDNDKYLRLWNEVEFRKIAVNIASDEEFSESTYKFAFCNKGGGFRKWYGNNEYVADWSSSEKFHRNGATYRHLLFREGITWSEICMGNFGARYYPSGQIFDHKSPGMFTNDAKSLWGCLGFLNTKVAAYILGVINPTISTGADSLRKIPISVEYLADNNISSIAQDLVALSKKDWDSFETSWDFNRHPLVLLAQQKKESEQSKFANSHMEKPRSLQWYFEQWKQECETRFAQLKANEEELNRIFIDIYGLQDELTPEVEDKDVTVRKADLQRDIKSFISYAVGCMFGRYSLDVDGLAYAGGQWDSSKYPTFAADADNIIPISDDEYFEDDIVGRFVKFVETVYGSETLEENLKFIADALGGKGQPKDVIRNYFINGFYADHCKMYQKRPIYWLFDSGKKNGFKCLIYMHRYQPDTIARIRTDYVHEQQSRYRTAIADLETRIANAPTSEKVKLNKQLKTLNDQATEIHEYEEKIHHLADQMISIDLDDGVKKNYEIFKDVLAKIK